MASWWGAARSSTEGFVGFMNHDLHASLLLTPDSTCRQEGWTGIRSMCECECECVWCGGGVVIVEMCRGDYAYSVLTDWLTDWLTVYVVGDLVLDLDSVELEKVKKCIMINTLQDDFLKIYWSFTNFLHFSSLSLFFLNDSDMKSNIYYVYIIYLFTSHWQEITDKSIPFFTRKM